MCASAVDRSVPYYHSSLVGREVECDRLDDYIRDPDIRLITVSGIAGVGKTRLVSYVARRFGEDTGDDLLFVSLSTVFDADLVIPEIGKALNLQGDELVNAIQSRLSTWRGVVVLDNFEQVIEAAPLIGEMRPNNPDLTIIVTSQRALQIEGERVVRLDPLAVPEADTTAIQLAEIPSVRLLMDRASSQDDSITSAFEHESTTAAIAEICRRLDGIPLAIELAASRLASLSPEVVLAQMDDGHNILSSLRRDRPERQRTMHSAIAWSYQLLPEETQRIFLALGPFSAGFGLDIVQDVANHLNLPSPAVDIVSELIHINLIRRVSGGAHPWYTMLVSMREFCLAELDHAEDRAQAEAFVGNYVIALADVSEANLTGPNSAEWIATLDRALPTIRSSVAWALAHEEPHIPMRVAMGMWRYLEREGRWRELVTWVDQALAWREKLDDETLIGGLLAKLTALEEVREISSAIKTAEEIEQLLDSADFPRLRSSFLLRMGALEHDQQHLEVAERYFREATEYAETHGFLRDATVGLGNLGLLAYQRADWENAHAWISRSKDYLSELGDEVGVASSLNNLGALSVNTQQLDKAREYLEESLGITRRLGVRRDLVYTLLNLAALLSRLDEQDEAEMMLTEAVHHSREIQLPVLEAAGTAMLADIELTRGRLAESASMVMRSIELAGPEENPRGYSELGLIVADLLLTKRNYSAAAAVLAKTEAFAEETEFLFEDFQGDRIAGFYEVINEHLPDASADRERGRLWSTSEMAKQFQQAARRTSGYSAGMVVTVHQKEVEKAPVAELTNREREILQLLFEGHSTQSMADQLSLSPRTVTTHIGNMMSKLEVNSRAELIAKTIQRPS